MATRCSNSAEVTQRVLRFGGQEARSDPGGLEAGEGVLKKHGASKRKTEPDQI